MPYPLEEVITPLETPHKRQRLRSKQVDQKRLFQQLQVNTGLVLSLLLRTQTGSVFQLSPAALSLPTIKTNQFMCEQFEELLFNLLFGAYQCTSV